MVVVSVSALFTLAALTPANALAAGCSDSWAAPVSGSWTTEADWSTGKVPTSTDEVCITTSGASSYTVTLTGSVGVKSLTLGATSGATKQTLLVGGPLSSGALDLEVNSTINQTGVLDMESGIGTEANVEAHTTATIANDGEVLSSASETNLLQANLTNEAGATVDVESGTLYQNANTTTTNEGTFEITGGATFTPATGGDLFVNKGSVTNDGSITLTDDASWTQDGPVTGDPVFIYNGGTRTDESGAASFDLVDNPILIGNIHKNQTLTLDALAGHAAQLTISGTVVNEGTLAFDQQSGGSEVQIGPNTATLVNKSVVDWQAQAGETNNLLQANLTNEAGATVDVESGTLYQNANTTTTNEGTFEIAGGATFTPATGGDLFVNKGSVTNDGSITLTDDASWTQDGPVTGDPVFIYNGGTLTDESGVASFDLVDNPILIGNIHKNQTVTLDALAGHAAQLTISGTVVNEGTLKFDQQSGGSEVQIGPDTATLVNKSVIDWQAQAGETDDLLQANLTNEAGATVHLQSGTLYQNANTTTTNEGTFEITGGATFTPATGGDLFVNKGSVTNDGSITLTDDASWTQDGPVTGDPVFIYNGGTLTDESGAASFDLVDNPILIGNIHKNQTVTLDALAGHAAQLTISGTVVNEGTLAFDQQSGGSEVQIGPNTATLVNKSVVDWQAQAGETNNLLQANLTNEAGATVDVESGTLYQNANTTTTNEGTFEIAASATFTPATGGDLFVNKGKLEPDIASATSFGTVKVSGDATFEPGGSIFPNLVEGYAPPVGTEFDVITSTAAISGTFAKVENNFEGDYSKTDIIAVKLIAPACATSPAIETQPSAQTVTAPTAATFKVKEGTIPADCTAAAIQWEVSTNKGTSWSPVTAANATGATTTTLQLSPTATSESGNEYRATLTNGHGKTTSSPALLRVAFQGRAYVANAGSDTVTPIELATNEPGAEIKVGEAPEGIAITPDGKTAYVVNYGSDTVTPIDVATSEPGAEIKVGSDPYGIAITPDGKTAYVVNFGSDSVTPIELATNTPGAEIKVGSTPDAIAITPDGKTAYVVNESSDSVTPIELATNTPGAEIKVGVNPTAIAITPDGKTAYIVNEVDGTVTPIELATNEPGAEIDAGGLEPDAIAITPDGKTAYVANYASGTVTPIELATNEPGAAIDVCEPRAIAITPDGSTAYVASDACNTVTPIDLTTNEPGAEIKVGETPAAIAITAAVVTKKPTRLTTALSGEGQSGGTITVKEGAAVSDEAALAGENIASATGTVTYKLYSDSACTTLVKEAGAETVSGGVVGKSEAKTLAAGTYYWQASYDGDSLNEASKSTCGAEIETVQAAVTKKSTTLTTSLSGEGKTGETITVKEGAAVTDSSTLSGENTASATGTVTYKLYSDSACTTLVKEAGAETVSGGVVGKSEAKTLAAGTYYWQASYDGDSLNEASKSTCGAEIETVQAAVTKKSTTLTTSLSGEGKTGETITVKEGAAVTDSSTLSGENIASATGTVTYKLYSDSACTTLVKEAGAETVSGGVVGKSEAKTLAAGTYYWQASYDGDSLNEASKSTCGAEIETVQAAVTKKSTTLTTSLSGEGKTGETITVKEGAAVTDSSTLSGENIASATGTVTYKLYSDSACTTLVKEAGAETVSGGVVGKSEAKTLAAGTYYWQASYDGDSLNEASKSTCGAEIETVQAAVTKKSTTLTTSLSGEGKTGETITVKEGAAVTDSSTLSGENIASATGTVTYKLYSDSACTTLVKEAGAETVSGGVVGKSEAKTLAAGTYYWQASYDGDSLNEASKSTCGAEIETVQAAVTKKSTTLTTSLSGEGKTGETITVKEGAAVTDSSTLSGENTASATGTVTYKLYSDSACTTLVKEAGAETVSGGVVGKSEAKTLAAGTYYWQASYDGDSLNEASKSTCGAEIETVEASPTVEARPHWYSNGMLIPEGQVEPVSSSGELTLEVPGSKLSVSCKVKDKATIVNPAGGGAGTDETTEVVFSSCSGKASPCSSGRTSWCCKKKSTSPCEKGARIELSSPGGPLRTHLVATPGQPVRDVIEGVVLEVRCSNGTVLDTYKGTLMPTIGSSVLGFGAGSGELEDSSGGKATVTGKDSLKGPKGDERITATLPPLPPHWYSNGTLIPEGQVEPVSSSGELTLEVPGSKLSVTCKLKDKATIVNPAGGGAGTDETTEVVFSSCSGKASPCSSGRTSWCCKKKTSLPCEKGARIELSATGGSLRTHLVATLGQPVRDVIEGVVLEVRCSNGTVLDTYKGTLMPTVGNSVLEFGAGSGELEDSSGGKATVSGEDWLKGPPGDEWITVDNPEANPGDRRGLRG